MSAVVAGSFSSGASTGLGQTPKTLVVTSGKSEFRLTLTGLDASNTVKTQKVVAGAWADQTTYNSDQTAVSVICAHGDKWRVLQVAQQAGRDIRYKMSLES